MPSYAYVYAPLSGQVTGTNFSGHSACNPGFGGLVDMGEGTSVRLYVSSYIRRVTMTTNLECCDGKPCGDNYKRTVVIKLWGGLISSCRDYLGEVAYGHLSGAVATSKDLTSSDYTNGIFVGNIVSGTCTGCFTAAHVHGECKSGTMMTYYPAPLTAGSTIIFRFVVPSICSS